MTLSHDQPVGLHVHVHVVVETWDNLLLGLFSYVNTLRKMANPYVIDDRYHKWGFLNLNYRRNNTNFPQSRAVHMIAAHHSRP